MENCLLDMSFRHLSLSSDSSSKTHLVEIFSSCFPVVIADEDGEAGRKRWGDLNAKQPNRSAPGDGIKSASPLADGDGSYYYTASGRKRPKSKIKKKKGLDGELVDRVHLQLLHPRQGMVVAETDLAELVEEVTEEDDEEGNMGGAYSAPLFPISSAASKTSEEAFLWCVRKGLPEERLFAASRPMGMWQGTTVSVSLLSSEIQAQDSRGATHTEGSREQGILAKGKASRGRQRISLVSGSRQRVEVEEEREKHASGVFRRTFATGRRSIHVPASPLLLPTLREDLPAEILPQQAPAMGVWEGASVPVRPMFVQIEAQVTRGPTREVCSLKAARELVGKVGVSDSNRTNVYHCGRCGRTFKHYSSLGRHNRYECGVEPKFQCSMCPLKFKQRYNMIIHTRRHLQKEKFECSPRGPATSPGALYPSEHLLLAQQLHMASKGDRGGGSVQQHHHQRASMVAGGFTCTRCGNSYVRPHSLSRHLRFECGPPPPALLSTAGPCLPPPPTEDPPLSCPLPRDFRCERCGRRYLRRRTLLRHRRDDCGTEPRFACPQVRCDLRFRRRYALVAHLIGVHGIARDRAEESVPGLPLPNPAAREHFCRLERSPAQQQLQLSSLPFLPYNIASTACEPSLLPLSDTNDDMITVSPGKECIRSIASSVDVNIPDISSNCIESSDQVSSLVRRPLETDARVTPVRSPQASSAYMLAAKSEGSRVSGREGSSKGSRSSRNKGTGRFMCQTCKTTYGRRDNLMRHVRLECGKEALFHCPQCKYRAKRKFSLIRHLRRGLGRRRSSRVSADRSHLTFSASLHPRAHRRASSLLVAFYQWHRARGRPVFPVYQLRQAVQVEDLPKEPLEAGMRSCSSVPVSNVFSQVLSERKSQAALSLLAFDRSFYDVKGDVFLFDYLAVIVVSFDFGASGGLGWIPPVCIDGLYACEQCGRTYKRKDSLRRHLQWECGKEPQFQCPFCPQRSKRKAHQIRHIRRLHKEEIAL
ncbi:hypothetical protein J437_LFUL013609 [Ladona fulva]|uniref:C2H2-type domain-containing protein n=1 Tax=Ladona fulva TaxID=123851 RepID=A0A8K0KG00_LADFU|nr:hypothetical protein J437_LFUL013609 [Ladona fulva]